MPQPPRSKFAQPGRVKTISGSILQPHDGGLRFILNIANTAGKMESPLYPLFDRRWPKIKQEVRGAYVTKTGLQKLGNIASNTAVQSDVWCLTMICQNDELKTDVVALQKCLKEVCKTAAYEHASIHISSLLLDVIPELKGLAMQEFVDQGVAVCFYEGDVSA